MMTGKCKDCKFWIGEIDPIDERYRGCICKKLSYRLRALKTEDDGFTEKFKAANMLVYEDVYSYHADFVTGPNFGCIHFQEDHKNRVKIARQIATDLESEYKKLQIRQRAKRL